MKLLYILTLLVGINLAIVTQFVCFALPPDAFVADALSSAPDRWSIQVDENLTGALSPFDLKKELTTALQERASFRDDIYKQSLFGGLPLIALSVIGLVREKKIEKLSKIEPDVRQVSSEGAPGASPGEPSI